jgi:hypothetical protein
MENKIAIIIPNHEKRFSFDFLVISKLRTVDSIQSEKRKRSKEKRKGPTYPFLRENEVMMT